MCKVSSGSCTFPPANCIPFSFFRYPSLSLSLACLRVDERASHVIFLARNAQIYFYTYTRAISRVLCILHIHDAIYMIFIRPRTCVCFPRGKLHVACIVEGYSRRYTYTSPCSLFFSRYFKHFFANENMADFREQTILINKTLRTIVEFRLSRTWRL